MIFLQAQREFEIRYYSWALTEAEMEVEKSFPVLSMFKCGQAWRLYWFMKLLDRDEQSVLARGLVKNAHRKAVDALAEGVSVEEKRLCSKYYAFWRVWELHQFMQHLDENQELDDRFINMHDGEIAQVLGENWKHEKSPLRSRLDEVFELVPVSFETELAERKKGGERIRFASKRNLQKAVTKTFNDAFSGQCRNSTFIDKTDPISGFEMNCCGWSMHTHFWFGRHESLISYNHLIASPTRIANSDDPANASPGMLLAHCISFGGWLGVPVKWEYITDEEVKPACDAAVRLCAHFFEIAPKLLKGLEFENVT